MDDKHARCLIDRATRIDIYRQLNPWDLSLNGDNCPSAADVMFHFLGSPAPGQKTSITPALQPDPRGYIPGPGVHFRPARLGEIIRQVRDAAPGFVVVVHGVRPQEGIVNGEPVAYVHGRRMVLDHYFCIVKLGPPENDAFWADCSRPEFAMFYPSRRQTPGVWESTIEEAATYNKLRNFEYTAGPYSVIRRRPPPEPRRGSLFR